MKNISYEFSEYTFARVSAMKDFLLKRHDYEKMKKMGPDEIVKFLQDHAYKEDINALAVQYSGIELMDRVLNRHLERIFRKLRTISSAAIRDLLDVYLRRYDFWNVKLILRSKTSGEKPDPSLYIIGGSLSRERLDQLASLDSAEEILEKSELVRKIDAKHLFDMENYMDAQYLRQAVRLAKDLPEQAKLFRQFFQYEVDVHNILLILKKILFNIPALEIEQYLVPHGKKLNERRVKDLIHLSNLSNFLGELRDTPYKDVLQDVEDDALLRYEIALKTFLLKKGRLLSNQHPLTVDVIVGYMFAKEIEIQNIRVIYKSKKLDRVKEYTKNLIIL